ncbi:MAG: oligosaccharide flippase family protein [Candidatus Poseidoniaceae archaeon]
MRRGNSQHGFAARKPILIRDTSWLTSSEIISVLLALIGQVILTRAVIQSDYGLWILLMDIFTAIFLIVDAGLPTIISRDGANRPDVLRKAVKKVWKLQFIVAIPFVIIGLPCVILLNNAPAELISLAAFICLVHIASYAPRSALRAAGQARFEAISKVVERLLITIGYGFLFISESSSILNYAFIFTTGSLAGLLTSVVLLYKSIPKSNQTIDELGKSWVSTKSLLVSALPFAVTLGVLPYITRIEKFFLAGISLESVAIFHVGQLAWMAGMIVPISISSALLPILGENRSNPERFRIEIDKAIIPIKILLVAGFILGSIFVTLILPVAFPEEYTNSTNGLDSLEVFIYLLSGWGFSLLAAPWNSALKAGENPWMYTLFITIVVILATLVAWAFIPNYGLSGAVLSANITCFLMLSLGILLSGDFKRAVSGSRKYDWILMISLCVFYPIAWDINKALAITLAVMIGLKILIIHKLVNKNASRESEE